MPPINHPLTMQVPIPLADRLHLANELYREYHTRCFWHCPPDLQITADMIPFVVKGLRAYGGRRGFIQAARLLDTSDHSLREPQECR